MAPGSPPGRGSTLRSVAIIGGVTLLGDGLNTMFTDVNTTLTANLPTAGGGTTGGTTPTP